MLEPSVSHVFSSFDFGKSGGLNPRNLKAFQAALKTCAPDILFTYNWGAIEAAVANRAGPRLAHIHFEDGFGPDETIDRQHMRRVLMRRLTLNASTTVVPSRMLHRVALAKWKLPQNRVVYIPNGVDLTRFEALRQPEAAQHPGPVIVGSVGPLRPEKNYPRLVRIFAAARAQAEDDSARLVIYGAGPSRDAIVEEAAHAGVSRVVDLPGETATPERAYRQFSIFALSSDTEQMPLSLIEAMASGLPALCANVGDISEMVAAENGKFVVSADNEETLAQRLAELMRDAPLRRRLGEANAHKARADYAFDTMLARHEALYDAAIAKVAVE